MIPSIEKIGTRWPEARPACVQFLMEQLARFVDNDREVNGFLVAGLVELHAVEAAPLVDRVFAARRVARIVLGDWEDVQVALGLLSSEALEQRRTKGQMALSPPSDGHQMVPPQNSARETCHREVGHRKAKSKMTKTSRKKNRQR